MEKAIVVALAASLNTLCDNRISAFQKECDELKSQGAPHSLNAGGPVVTVAVPTNTPPANINGSEVPKL